MRMSRIRVLALILCLCTFLTGMGIQESVGEAAAPSTGKSMTVTIGKPKAIEITGDAADSVSFKSTKKTVATVNKEGVVKGVKIGSCEIKITVRYTDNDDESKSVVLKKKVTVVKKSRFSAAKIYKKILAKKKKYKEGKRWTNDNLYVWNALPNVSMYAYGCVGFACIMSDSAFGRNTSARQIDHPSASKVRVGDILRTENDMHSVIVLKIESDCFVIAEGNYGGTIHWGRKMPKNQKIDYLYTRYEG